MKEDAYERVHQASLLVRKEREASVERAVEARNRMKKSQAEYAAALMEASQLGVPNTKLARSLGVSETAVRNYLRRHQS